VYKVACLEEMRRNIYSVLLGKPARRRALGQTLHRCEGIGADHKLGLINLLKPTLHNTRFNIKKFYIVIKWNMCVLYRSWNKQQILPNRTLKDGFYNQCGECFQRGTHRVLI